MTLEAYAKVNLTLEVGNLRPDGYHDLRSVVAPISLFDVVELDPAGDIVDASGIDFGAENLAVRAARALRRAAGVEAGVRIAVDKRIPMGAGLGGGSADAAATLVGLDSLWGLGWGRERLMKVAEEVGSDVPALVHGGVVLMEGRGERVSGWKGEADRRPLVLLKPSVHASTPEVYREFRAEDRGMGPNDLQPAACRLHPEIRLALEALVRAGGRDARMTGSGSAVFARAEDRAEAERILERLAGGCWKAIAEVTA